MRFQFSFRRMDASLPLRVYAEQKLRDKIKKFDPRASMVNLSFEFDRHEHVIHCWVAGGDGTRYQVEQRDRNDFYAAVDQLIEKLEMQLRRHKEKKNNYRWKRWDEYLHLLDQGERMRVDPDSIDAEEILREEYRASQSSSWA